MQHSYFIIKPEAMAQADNILWDLNTSWGIKIVEMKTVKLTEEMVRELYPHVNGLMISVIIEKEADKKCYFVKVEGENVIEELLEACRTETNPSLCKTGTIRNTYYDPKKSFKVEEETYYSNIIHRSRDQAEAKRDEEIFNEFPPG